MKTKLGPIFLLFSSTTCEKCLLCVSGSKFFVFCTPLVCVCVRRPNERKRRGNDYWPHTHTHTQKNIQQLKRKKTASEGGGVSFGYSIFVVVVVYPPFCFGFYFIFSLPPSTSGRFFSIGCESVVTTSVHGSL